MNYECTYGETDLVQGGAQQAQSDDMVAKIAIIYDEEKDEFVSSHPPSVDELSKFELVQCSYLLDHHWTSEFPHLRVYIPRKAARFDNGTFSGASALNPIEHPVTIKNNRFMYRDRYASTLDARREHMLLEETLNDIVTSFCYKTYLNTPLARCYIPEILSYDYFTAAIAEDIYETMYEVTESALYPDDDQPNMTGTDFSDDSEIMLIHDFAKIYAKFNAFRRRPYPFWRIRILAAYDRYCKQLEYAAKNAVVEGHGKITTGGLTLSSVASAAQAGIGIASALGMMNPVGVGDENISESEKPAGNSTFDAPETVIETLGSRIQVAAPIVQDTISSEFSIIGEPSKQGGLKAEMENFAYSDIAKRPAICGTAQWNTTQATGSEIYKFRIPQDLNLAHIIKSTMCQHAFVSWDALEFTVHYNANAFCAGFARVSVIPSEYYTDPASSYGRAITCTGIDLNASAMTQASLIVPFCYNKNWIGTKTMQPESMKQCGYFTIHSMLPLMGVEGDAPNLQLRIMVQVHGLRLAGLTLPFETPLFAPFEPPRDNEVEGQGKEDTASVVYFPRSNAFSNYEAGTKPLKNAAEENVAMSLIQTEEDPMDIGMLMRKPGIETIFSWSIDTAPGVRLLSTKVMPYDNFDYPYPKTPLAYFARYGTRWNGKIKYKIMVAKSAFHTGKLVVIQVPAGHLRGVDSYLAFNHIVFDLKEDNIFEFEVGYFGDHATLAVPQDPRTGKLYLNWGCTLDIAVHTPLQTNTSMQPVVNCALWKSAGSDFRLFGIAPPVIDPPLYHLWVFQNGIYRIAPGLKEFVMNLSTIYPPNMIEGHYRMSPGVTLALEHGSFTITEMWVVDGWLSSVPNLPAGTFKTKFVSSTAVASELIRTTDIEGHSGITSAMHDKLEGTVPLLGTDSDNSHPNMVYEELRSLLQILERPHDFNAANEVFHGFSDEVIDSFSIFGKCFAYTTGYVQLMIEGGHVVMDPLMGNDHVSITGESYLTGGVRMPGLSSILLVDCPPMTDATICMNVFDREESLTRPETWLTKFKIQLEDEITGSMQHIRAGPGFSYHMWCGIPTPVEQERLKRLQVNDFLPKNTLKSQIETLREKMRNVQIGEIEGHSRCDGDMPGLKDSKKKSKSVSKKVVTFFSRTRTQPSMAPNTERDVRSDLGTTSSESTGDDDEIEIEDENESEASFPPRKFDSPFLPKSLTEGISAVASSADAISHVSRRAGRSLGTIEKTAIGIRKDFKTVSDRIESSVKKASESINKAANKVGTTAHRGRGLLETAYQRAESEIESIKEEGLINLLFGKIGEKSKMIQILLVDAIECVAIRKPAKWIGMLAKLAIAFGLTNSVSSLILGSFKKHTNWSAPNENQQGEISGQAGGDFSKNMPLICSLISVIVMFASFATCGGGHIDRKKFPTMWDWMAERARQTTNIDRGMESFMKLFEKINKWTVKLIARFMPLDEEMFESLREDKFLRSAKQIIELSAPLLKVKVLVKIFMDWELRKRVFELDEKYSKFLEYSADPVLNRKYMPLINRVGQLVKELRGRIISITDSTNVRIDPWHCSFYGSTAIGKSYLMSAVSYVLGRSQNVPIEDLFYARTPSTKHYDNYRGQEFMGIDDTDQQDNEEMAGEMITIKSNVPKVLPMAHLETKGCMFTSRGILSTTNIPYPEPKSIKCKDAYKRRRDVLVECVKLVGVEGKQQDLTHLKFLIRDSVNATANPIAGPFNFAELCYFLAQGYSQHIKIQHQLVGRVAPDTEFRKLYIYGDSDSAKLKILEIVEEFTADRTFQDKYIRDFNEIETRTSNTNFTYTTIGENVEGEDFTMTHDVLVKSKLPLTVLDPDANHDFEDDDDPLIGMDYDDENENHDNEVEAHGKYDESGDESDASSSASLSPFPHEPEPINENENTYDLNVILRLRGLTVSSDHLAVSEYDDAPDEPALEPFRREEGEEQQSAFRRAKIFLQKLFGDISELEVTEEMLDLLCVLSDRRLGVNKRECEEMTPFVPTTRNTRLRELRRLRYCTLRNFLRKVRTCALKNSSDDLFDKFCIAMDAYAYYLNVVEVSKDPREISVALAHVAFFSGKATVIAYEFTCHQFKQGIVSPWLRNLNNQIMPDHVGAVGLEVGRTVLEGAMLPYSAIQRLIYEATGYIRTGLLYTAKLVYTCISERQGPEIHNLIKIGLFLLGGFLLWHGVLKKNSFVKRKFFPSSKIDPNANPEKQQYLEGEGGTDDDGNTTLPILERSHIGMPQDGAKYAHYHMCERCRKVFRHIHANTEKSHTYRLLCGPCYKKAQNMHKESASKGEASEKPERENEPEVDEFDTVTGEAIASSGGAMKDRFTKLKKVSGEGKELKDAMTQHINVQPDASTSLFNSFPSFFGKKPTITPEVGGHACDDVALMSILPSIKNNIADISVEGRHVNCLFLCGKWLVTVGHIFSGLHSRELPVVINMKGQNFHGYIDTFRHIKRPDEIVIDGRTCPDDVCYVNLIDFKTLPAFRDIRGYIPSTGEISKACGKNAMLIEKTHGQSELNIHHINRLDVLSDRVVKTSFGGEEIRTHVALSWHYNVAIEKGSCGSPVCVRDTHCPKKLVGFHYGAVKGTTLAYAYPLYREQVDRMISEDVVVGHCDTDEVEKMCEEVFNCFSDDLPENHKLDFVPTGRVKIIGRLKKEHVSSMPRRSDIVPSPFKDQIYLHNSEPAILTDTDPRSVGDIIQRGLDKFGKIHGAVRKPALLKKINAYKLQKMEKLTSEYNGPLRTLTQDEAVNGIPGFKYIPPLRMDTSPGFPYVKMRPAGSTGRKFLFEEIGTTPEGQPRFKPGPLLQRHLDEIWQGLLDGELYHNYYLDCLKDERRKLARLYKTRFFNVHNVAWLITYRRLYLAAAAFRLSNKFVLGTALGIDMHGPDASVLMNYLREVGNKYLAVDVKEWDGSLPSEELFASFQLNDMLLTLHEFRRKQNIPPPADWKPDPDSHRRRLVLAQAISTRIHIIGNCVYMCYQGMPSGTGATADGNSDCHDTQNYANWIEIWTPINPEMATCEAKDLHTREVTLGDDAGGCVSDEAAPVYNNTSVAATYKQYGIICQLPSKTGNDEDQAPFTSVEEFEFLKCGFVRNSQYRSIWHMQMNKSVIEELTNWVTIHGDPYELFYSNCSDAQLFAYGHGKEYYDEFTAKVNNVVDIYSKPLLTTTYEDQNILFLEKFGKTMQRSNNY